MSCNPQKETTTSVYPATKKVDTVDSYHGVQVSDPYRWLEDDKSEETAEWVKSQNEVTFGYLNQIQYRDKLKKRLEEIWNYPKYSAPFKTEGRYFFYKNNGLQNQFVLYSQKTLNEEPEIILDPNTWSKDGTVSLSGLGVSTDGKYLAYWTEKNLFSLDLYIADAATGKNQKRITRNSFNSHIDQYSSYESSVAWSPDSRKLAIVAFAKGRNRLIIAGSEGKILEELDLPGLDGFSNPSWSGDGQSVVVTGMK